MPNNQNKNKTMPNNQNKNNTSHQQGGHRMWLAIAAFIFCLGIVAWSGWVGGDARGEYEPRGAQSGRAARRTERLRRAREQQGSCRIYRFSDGVSCYPSGCDEGCPASEEGGEIDEIDTITRAEREVRYRRRSASASGSVLSSVSVDVCQIVKVDGLTTCEPENCSEDCG